MTTPLYRPLALSLLAVVVGLSASAPGLLHSQELGDRGASVANNSAIAAERSMPTAGWSSGNLGGPWGTVTPRSRSTVMTRITTCSTACSDSASFEGDDQRRPGRDDPRQFLEDMAEASRRRRPAADPVVRYAVSRGLRRSDSPGEAGESCTDCRRLPARPECR